MKNQAASSFALRMVPSVDASFRFRPQVPSSTGVAKSLVTAMAISGGWYSMPLCGETSQIPAEERKPITAVPTGPFSQEDRDYLDSIADIVKNMKPFEDLMELSEGCPDPDRYVENEG